jgi:myo-inositol-1(or 4)-monophosphatase
MLNFTINLVKNAGKIHLRYFKRTGYSKKSKREIVTTADIESEKYLISRIMKKFPQDNILSEEKGLRTKRAARRKWIIDPLDGTNNFAHKIPFFCVSIALEVEGELVLGVVYNPYLDELFYSDGNNKSYVNGKRIYVSAINKLTESFLTTGFPYNRRRNNENNLNYFNEFTLKCLGIRRLGSAAIDLCYVASGIFDGYWELKLQPWDIAAGGFILQNAGGRVTNFLSDRWNYYTGDVVGTNSHLHSKMQKIIKNLGFRI